jgi:hypothetical protein
LALAFRDIFALLMVIFFLFALVPHKPEDATEEQSQIPAQGQLVVMMKWPDNIDRDIDVWVRHPLSPRSVGWSNKSDVHCDLLRDDLGARADIDPSSFNYEQITCRTLQIGEYIVNVHFFGGGADHRRSTGVDTSTDIKVQVDIVFVRDGIVTHVDAYNVVLGRPGDWVTTSRFVVDDRGNLMGDVSRKPFPMHFTGGAYSPMSGAGP